MGSPSDAYMNVKLPVSGLAGPLVAAWWMDGLTGTPVDGQCSAAQRSPPRPSFIDVAPPPVLALALPPALPGYSNAVPNSIYYRVTTTPSASDAARIAADVATLPNEYPEFSPSFVAVVTWFAVGSYASGTETLNTYQAVFASDYYGRSFITLWSVLTSCASQ